MRKSTLTHLDEGNGLFATRDFAKGELVTEYAGRSMRNQIHVTEECKVQTHITHVSAPSQGLLGPDLYIQSDRTPVQGRGGGSFANQSRKSNVELCMQDGKAFMRAKAPITSGSEIFLYGTDKRVQMGEARYYVTINVDGGQVVATKPIEQQSSKRSRVS